MHHKAIKTTLLAAALTAAVAISLPTTAAGADSGPSARITGSVGENVSDTDGYDGRHLRYVGDPAPAGYSDWYQHGSPYILTASPEDTPVTMAGTLDLSGMTEDGQVAIIGLHDADALRAGDRGEKAEVGIYVAYRSVEGGSVYDIGVTDGDAGGGEFSQSFARVAAEDLTGGVADVEFVVDGAAEPETCASDEADVATADGCMTLTVNGNTVTDSYGTIVPEDVPIETELGNGAHPGWYAAYNAGDGPEVGVRFDLAVSPLAAPVTKEDCKHGAFEAYGFKNQGRCVASLQANMHAHKS